MRIAERIRQLFTRLLTTPSEELGSWARLARSQIHLWRFCARRLHENNAMAMSSALSFRTIFALIPTLILAFLMLKSLGVVQDKRQALQDFLRELGLSQIAYVEQSQTAQVTDDGAEGNQVTLADKIESLIAHVESQLTVGKLGPLGVLLLIWTVITLLTTVERSLNRIFEAPKSRSIGRRVVTYWSAVTLGPVAMIAAAYLGRTVASAAQNYQAMSWVIYSVGWAWPLLVGVILLAGLYVLLPNTNVRYRAAIGGAIVAVPLWLAARWLFALYVDHFGKQSVYGAIGLVPLFLMWLNLCWWIFLFGAEVAHTAANLSRMQSAELAKGRLLGPWDLLAAIVAVARSNVASGRPVSLEDVSESLQLPADTVAELLSRLSNEGILCRVADEDKMKYLLARPAGTIRVSEVLQIGDAYSQRASGQVAGADVAAAVSDIRAKAQAGIGQMTIEQVIGS